MFDTETMAELCAKQGLVDQALGIYRRLSLSIEAEDPATRRRYEERIVELEQRSNHAQLETPGLRIQLRDQQVHIEWRLPADTQAPTLQLLLLRRTPGGIEADARTVPLSSAHGRTSLAATDLHSVRAAAGRMTGERFVPLIRLPGVPSSPL